MGFEEVVELRSGETSDRVSAKAYGTGACSTELAWNGCKGV